MRKKDAWDQVDPDAPSSTLTRHRRPVPGDIKRKETLTRNRPVVIEVLPATTRNTFGRDRRGHNRKTAKCGQELPMAADDCAVGGGIYGIG